MCLEIETNLVCYNIIDLNLTTSACCFHIIIIMRLHEVIEVT